MVVTLIVGLVTGFVVGVLFGRKNKNSVESAVTAAKKVKSKR